MVLRALCGASACCRPTLLAVPRCSPKGAQGCWRAQYGAQAAPRPGGYAMLRLRRPLCLAARPRLPSRCFSARPQPQIAADEAAFRRAWRPVLEPGFTGQDQEEMGKGGR